ncbi:MAG: hypothetical protein U0P30_17620 [Vicinamibacterales bacterium]
MTQTVQRVFASFVFAFVCAAGAAQAQSLADVAKAANADKKAQPKTTKVYTNENLRQDITPSPTAPPEGGAATTDTVATTTAAPTPGADAAPAADSGARDEKYWHDRITAARDAVDRGESAAKAFQNQINSLVTDFINRDDPAQRAGIEKERTKVVAELERTQREIAAAKKAIATIEDEARKAGVPAGWLR